MLTGMCLLVGRTLAISAAMLAIAAGAAVPRSPEAAGSCPRDERSVELLIANLTGANLTGANLTGANLTGDGGSDVRAAAAKALGCGGDPRSIAPLVSAVAEKDSVIRLAAVDALARFGEGVFDGDLPLRLMATRRAPGNPQAGPLAPVAHDDSAVDAIGALVDNATPGGQDDDWSRSDAAWALGRLGSPRATYFLSRALGDPDNVVRAEAARALVRLGDKRGLPVLAQHLADWFYGPRILLVVRDAGWAPESDADRIHLWIARRDRTRLVGHWDKTKAVLVADLHSRFALNALYAAIAIGRADFIPDATSALVTNGSQTMAEAFLNCGQPDLKQAAEAWAKTHDYTILAGPGDPPVSWGEM